MLSRGVSPLKKSMKSFLSPKRVTIKMFLALFNAVSVGTIGALFDKHNQPWFKRAHLGKFLGIVDIKVATKNADLKNDICERAFIPTGYTTLPCSEPKD